MKWKLTVLIAILISASLDLEALRGGFAGGGRAIPGSGVRPGIAGLSHNTGERSNHYGRGSDYNRNVDSGWWNSCYLCDGWYSDYPAYDGGRYGFQPGALILLPVPQVSEPPAPPPPPAVPALHEYSWPDSGGDAATAFAIVAKDGTVQRAIAVWVQDNRLRFITPDGIGRELVLNNIDRPNTVRMNAGLGLKLPAV
jgi:hypothetical protein